MDPIAALGLVGNVITIIQAGIETVSDMKDVYGSTSGAPRRNEVVEQTMNDLDSKCKELLSSIGTEQDLSNLSSTELELRGIAWNCAESGMRLRNLLDSLKAGPRKRDALFKTVKSRWKRAEIDQLRKEVSDYQAAINTHILVDLNLQSRERQHQKQKAASNRRDALIDALKDALWFPEMSHRSEQIRDAHPKTFQWIFGDCDDTDGKWDCFVCWLKNGQIPYWVNGKAGSGKSTLMNYVSYEQRTIKHLRHWSGGNQVVIAKFFFWNSGSALERSVEGLVRTLLYQILEQCPQAASTMFPSLRPNELSSLCDAESRNAYWTEKKLQSALSHLLSVPDTPDCFCFFIDGLDEFLGDPSILIDMTRRLSNAPHIKMCVSSRPLSELVDAFATFPSLKLEKLTATDITEYVNDELKRNPHGEKLASNEEKRFDRLVQDISHKASGVFLWVSLVVSRLSKDLSNGGDILALDERLNELPSDLHDLFSCMIGGLESHHRKTAASVFRIFFAAPEPDSLDQNCLPTLSLMDLFFAKDASVASSLAHSSGRTDWSGLASRLWVFERQTVATCCGLIEFIDGGAREEAEWMDKIAPEAVNLVRTRPRLLHQSVKEFLEEQEVLPGFPSRPTYNDYERLLVARLITVKTLLEPGLPQTAINALADYFLCIAGHLEEQAFATNIVLIDEIDRCCMACARASGYVSWYSPSNYNCRDIIDTISHAGVDGSGEKDVFEQIDVATELDIVSYAAAFGLFLYTKAKICERPSLCQRSDKLPILHAIHCVDIASVGEAFGKPSWQLLLRTLLDGDADPNLEYKGKSAWRLRLDAQGMEQMSPSSFTRFPLEFAIFLDHGADCNQTFDYSGTLGSSKVQGPRNEDTDNSQNLYSVLQATMEAQKAQRETGDEIAPVSMRDLIANMFFMLMDGASAPEASQDSSGTHGSSIDAAQSKTTHQPLIALPTWRISLLYWATHAVVETADAQAFRHRLVQEGAELQRPFIAKIFASRIGTSDVDAVLSKNCNRAESAQLTEAWRKQFPRYHIALFPQLINAGLSTLGSGGFLRAGGPLRADELLRASNIIHEGVSRSEGGFPCLVEISRIGERLRHINFLSNEGLVRASQLLRSGKLLADNGVIRPVDVAKTELLGNDDESIDQDTRLRVLATFRDEGLTDDTMQLLDASGFVRDGDLLPAGEVLKMFELFRNNGLLTTGAPGGIFDPFKAAGDSGMCAVM